MKAKLIVLGAGTSLGIPWVACNCHVCSSDDPLDQKTRCSSLIVAEDGSNVLIDCGPEFRLQSLRENITHIDNVLFTHPHADHICGINDLLPYSQLNIIRAYGNSCTIDDIKVRFPHLFNQQGFDPRIQLNKIQSNGALNLGPFDIIPIPVFHGDAQIFGYRIGNLVYITDASSIPTPSYELMNNVDILVINGLRREPHKSHISFFEMFDIIGKIQPKCAYVIHVTHDLTHSEMESFFNEERLKNPIITNIEIHPAYDGQVIENIVL